MNWSAGNANYPQMGMFTEDCLGGSEASTTSIMSSRSNPFGERIAGVPTSSQRLRS